VALAGGALLLAALSITLERGGRRPGRIVARSAAGAAGAAAGDEDGGRVAGSAGAGISPRA
jgi:hypothetical protein